mgnify:CR=1 FL=1
MRNLFQLIPISREYLGLGNKSDISPVMVNHRQIPRLGLLELVHHTVHLLINIDICRSGTHEIIYMKRIVLVSLEHVSPDILQRYESLEMLSRNNDREYVSG